MTSQAKNCRGLKCAKLVNELTHLRDLATVSDPGSRYEVDRHEHSIRGRALCKSGRELWHENSEVAIGQANGQTTV